MASRDVPANDACTVRLATEDDTHLLQTVLDLAAGESDAHIHGDGAAELLGKNQVHLALVAGEPVGCVLATKSAACGIHGLIVAPYHRGRDYGATLVQAVIEHNDATRGPGSYWTAVDPRIAGATDRFLRLGFLPIHEAAFNLMVMLRTSSRSAADEASEAA